MPLGKLLASKVKLWSPAFLVLAYQCLHFTSEHVINFKRHETVCGQLVGDDSRWVEWIREILI